MVCGGAVIPWYWQYAEATGRSLEEDWPRTEDIGQFDGEGYSNLKDWSKGMINPGGSNIYPL